MKFICIFSVVVVVKVCAQLELEVVRSCQSVLQSAAANACAQCTCGYCNNCATPGVSRKWYCDRCGDGTHHTNEAAYTSLRATDKTCSDTLNASPETTCPDCLCRKISSQWTCHCSDQLELTMNSMYGPMVSSSPALEVATSPPTTIPPPTPAAATSSSTAILPSTHTAAASPSTTISPSAYIAATSPPITNPPPALIGATNASIITPTISSNWSKTANTPAVH